LWADLRRRSHLTVPEQWVIAAPDEETAKELSENLAGHEVAVEANSELAAEHR
jgi:hypothetical protein